MAGKKSKLTLGQTAYMIMFLLVIPAVFLFLSGDWFWVEGWLFCLWYMAMYLSAFAYLYFQDPGLLEERLIRPGTGGQKGWDKYFLLIFIVAFFLWLIIMPLDAKRFGWTASFPLWIKILGGIWLIPSFFLIIRSYVDNPFLSPLVRIQKERKQYVVTTGVYGFVRHPMYLGAILWLIGAPMLLGSLYGIALGVVMSFLLALRAIGEEKMLVEELEGYADYKKKVKFRLIPFIW